MFRLLSALGILLACVIAATSQDSLHNLVPNGGFEEYSSTPLGWFYTGKDYTRVMRYWESPTAASPDIYGPKVYVPSEWQDKGFGQATSHGGKSMTGITLLGCKGGKPHCREYIQIQLTEPMIVGQRYEFRLWTKHLPLSVRIDRLDIAFVTHRISRSDDRRLDITPQLVSGRILSSKNNSWIELHYEFIADKAYDYLIIGNFASDSDTRQQHGRADQEHLHFAYYYLDDISLKKLPPILEVPAYRDDLSKADLKQGETFQLHNIYFDHDRADFLPRSYRELNTLLEILKSHPNMRIQVQGHTDNVGTPEYNYQLSLARARAVVDYLVTNGIAPERVTGKGYGSTMPLATNASEEGRRVNRRVEFLILSK